MFYGFLWCFIELRYGVLYWLLCISLFCDVLLCVMVFYDVVLHFLWCYIVFYLYFLWCSFVFYGSLLRFMECYTVLWCMFYGVLIRCSMVSLCVLKCFMAVYCVLWSDILFCDVFRENIYIIFGSMVFYDVSFFLHVSVSFPAWFWLSLTRTLKIFCSGSLEVT